MVGVVATNLLPEAFKPVMHVQCKHALVPVKDGLPHFLGFPAKFGGSDDVASW